MAALDKQPPVEAFLSEFVVAALLALALSLLICLIEAPNRSKVRLRACIGLAFLLYLLIFIVGNTFTTLVASTLLTDRMPSSWAALKAWFPFFYAFFGVFAFQGIVSNTNVTFFGKGVLTIEDWISKAREDVVGKAVEKDVQLKHRTALAAARILKDLPEKDLNAYISQYMEANSVATLTAKAREDNASPQYYKALALANAKPDEVAAICRAHRKGMYKKTR
jgi:hypothetical protein